MALFGLDGDAFGEIPKEEHFGVFEENWETVMVFLGCQTQWRKEITAMSGQVIWHGLRYLEAETVIRLMGYQKKASEIFMGLREMEQAALPILNARSQK